MELREIKKYFKDTGLTFVRLMENGELVVPWPNPNVSIDQRWKEIEAYANSPMVDPERLVIEGKMAARSKAVQKFPLSSKKPLSNGAENTPAEPSNYADLVRLFTEQTREIIELKTRVEQLEAEFAEAIEEASALDEGTPEKSVLETVIIPTGLSMLDRYLSLKERAASVNEPPKNNQE